MRMHRLAVYQPCYESIMDGQIDTAYYRDVRTNLTSGPQAALVIW